MTKRIISLFMTLVLLAGLLTVAAVPASAASFDGGDGSRKVVSVEEIIGYQEGKIKTQELFTFDRTKETLVRSDHRLVHTGKLQKSEF